MQRTAGLAALAREYDEFIALVDSIADDEWGAQSLCSEWSVRDVVAHIVALDRATFTGEFFLALLPGRDIESLNQSTAAAWRERPIVELVAALDRWSRRQRRFFDIAGRALWNVRIPTPLGRLRGGSLAGARVYDLWCHNYDIAVPLGRPEPAPERAGAAVEWMLDAMGQMVGPKLADRRGATIGLDVTGPVKAERTWVVGERDSYDVDTATLAKADSVIRADTRTFLLAGSGRHDPIAALDAGELEAAGDEALAREFLAAWLIY